MSSVEIPSPIDSSLLFGTLSYKELPVYLVLAIVGVAAYGYNVYERKPDVSHIPVLGAELGDQGRRDAYSYKGKDFLQRGYDEFNKKDKAFQIPTTEGPKVILSLRQLEDLRGLSDSVVDNVGPTARAVMHPYTQVGSPDDSVVHVIKTKLSTHLNEISGIIESQIDRALEVEFPGYEDWTKVQVYGKILRIVAAVSTRVFVGSELTENDEWLSTTINYTEDMFRAANDIKMIHPFLRPLTYWTLDSYKRMRHDQNTALRLLVPIIKRRRAAIDDPNAPPATNMTQWMMQERKKRGHYDQDYAYMAQSQLQLSIAAIHTSSMALTNMIYDICSRPEYVEIIREEVKEQLAKNNNSWEGALMSTLEKTDSIMKESQRFEPVGYSNMDRYIKKDTTLSDGTFLPKNALVSGNTRAITMDNEILGSDSDPFTFDGLRYYKMRNKLMKTGLSTKEVAGKHQFASVSSNSLHFGFGRHACPGRFFASNEVKSILVKILVNFDIKTEGNVRHPNMTWEQQSLIDGTKTIEMRRVLKK